MLSLGLSLLNFLRRKPPGSASAVLAKPANLLVETV
jgi:hypothetical protein